MRLDDRTGDSESHAHSLSFCREERVEYLIGMFESRAGVADFNLDCVPCPAHTHPKNLVTGNGVHRLDAVANKIDQHLLDLDAIERDQRKVAFDVDIHANATPYGFLGHEVTRFVNDTADRRA